jgi:hypothetical protein
MQIKKTVFVAVALAALGLGAPSIAHAGQSDKLTHLTFSQSVAIPGKVLPAGTYTFQVADSFSGRHIVQIFNRNSTQLIATIMAVPDYRLTPTDDTVITFGERSSAAPQAITHWFYPGDTDGQEFVY